MMRLRIFCLAFIFAVAGVLMGMASTQEAETDKSMVVQTEREACKFEVAKTMILEKKDEVVEVDERRYFDVPLDEDLQDHIYELCEERGIDPAIVVAMIKVESNFKATNMGDGGDSYGLMQIQPKWHSERMERLGVSVEELLDPYHNITVGVDFLAELIGRDRSLEWALMAYNGGYKHANRKIEAGELSKYCEKVLDYARGLKLYD